MLSIEANLRKEGHCEWDFFKTKGITAAIKCLNTSHLSKGIYIYELRPVPFSSGNKNGVIKKGKVVKD
jgi:hypothetical protein